MLAARSGLSPRRIPSCIHARRPSNKRFFIQTLSDGFLDLAIALPFPPSAPAYSATIILVTVATRLVLFPVALWGKKRVQRLEEVVLPELERLKPIISKEVLEDMKRTGVSKQNLVPAALQQIHLARMKERVSSEQKRLIAEHNCHIIPSMVASPAIQLPVFITMTMMFTRLAQDPTPFDSEAFLTLTTLNHPDPTWILPTILGMVTMANVDSNNWLLSAVQKDRLRKMEERREQQLKTTGKSGFQVSQIIQGALHPLAVLRILWAGFCPGSVVLYWTTSAICGLIQTWVLDYRPGGKSTPLQVSAAAPASTIPEPAPANVKPVTPQVHAKPATPPVKAKSAKKQQGKQRYLSW
ncbi:60Kd inner membrane protein-domain-containing protein [Mycena rosella]|uniref:60Kd inner membrane protein-domain-containing protein n=1 Tax=Mycena rosella TaxID=1033263 RepID=A0AAD7CVS7_MYCRO|nr:60Kd inner membrane protein-domain-containing protein [Mycena rosella]